MKFKKLTRLTFISLFVLFLISGINAAVPEGKGIQKLQGPMNYWEPGYGFHAFNSKGDIYHIIFGQDGYTRVGTWLTLTVAVGDDPVMEDGIAESMAVLQDWVQNGLWIDMQFDAEDIEYSLSGWMWDFPFVYDLGDGWYQVIYVYHYFLPPQHVGTHYFSSQTYDGDFLVFDTSFTITYGNKF